MTEFRPQELQFTAKNPTFFISDVTIGWWLKAQTPALGENEERRV